MPTPSECWLSTCSRSGLWYSRLTCLLCCIWCLTATGCFEKTYAERMKLTERYYNHLDILNRNLNEPLQDSGFTLRVPRGFEYIPKPLPPAPNADQPQATVKETELHDTRQPSYLGVKLPGMIAAWEKSVSIDEGESTGARKAYIYLLSNAPLYQASGETPNRLEPSKFQEYTVNLLAGDIGVQFKADEWLRQSFPNGTTLVPQVTYDSLIFMPARQFEESKMTFKVFITSDGDMQALILVVYPDAISISEKLNERVDMMLETLRIPSQPVANSSTGGGGSGAPTGL